LNAGCCAPIEAAHPISSLTLVRRPTSSRRTAPRRAALSNVTTANWWLNDPFQIERGARILPAYEFAFKQRAAARSRPTPRSA